MNQESFQKELIKKADQNHIYLKNEESIQLYKFMNFVIQQNEKVNLTAIVDPQEFIIKHFIDSLIIEKYIKDKSNVIDIGTGAGFPGIPLKIVRKDLIITLIDSLKKRVDFLDQAIAMLNLENIEVVHNRAEDYAKYKKEKYDVAVSRAVAPLNILLEYMMPFIKIGGKCICLKGPNINNESIEAKKAIELLGGKIEKKEEYIIQSSEDKIQRTILIIKKIKKTPNYFPRKAGKAKTDPII